MDSLEHYIRRDRMIETTVRLKNSVGTGFIIPLGPVNLVAVYTKYGFVGCGAFDVFALNNFGYPAARVKPSGVNAISDIGDLLSGTIKEANEAAQRYGILNGMNGKDALDLLS
jgi:uncharacterized protein YunC (DUF1805 family)